MQYIDSENVYLDNIETHPEKEGYFKVPIFEGLWVTMAGEFYSEHKGRLLFVHMTKNGYPTVRVRGQNRYVHILLATTFIKKPDNVDNPWVNHRDGNKHNFKLGNLEWTTPSKNLIHAFKNNLRTDNRGVLLKDLLTDEITEFSSLNECARYLGKNAARPSEYLSGCNSTPLYGRYDLIWKDGEWNRHTREDLNKVRPGVPRPIVVINVSNNEPVIYGSAEEASKAINIPRPEISTRANLKETPVYRGYIFKWLFDWVLINKTMSTKAT